MITEQRTRLKKNIIIQYVWADDIRKIKLRRRGKGGGIKIWTKDGDACVMPNIEIELPDNVVKSLVYTSANNFRHVRYTCVSLWQHS